MTAQTITTERGTYEVQLATGYAEVYARVTDPEIGWTWVRIGTAQKVNVPTRRGDRPMWAPVSAGPRPGEAIRQMNQPTRRAAVADIIGKYAEQAMAEELTSVGQTVEQAPTDD